MMEARPAKKKSDEAKTGKGFEEEMNTEDIRKTDGATNAESSFCGFKKGFFQEPKKEKVEKKDVSGQKRVNKSEKRKNNDKLKKAPGKSSDSGVVLPSNEPCDEKVKMKIALRSKISELELEEETRKLKISSSIEEENATSSAFERKIKDALEKKGQLRVKVEDIESEIESLLEKNVAL